jgi:predicted dehydrogenase
MNHLSEPQAPRVAVIGCGTIGRTHLEAYRASGVGPVALADADQAALDAATATYGGRGYLDYRDLILSGEVDAVSVCTPPASHREIVVAALEAGIAVLCEKPMATTVQDADAMAAVAARTGTLLTIGLCHRFQPHIERLRELAQEGELGTTLMFRNRFAGHLGGVEKTWFARPDVAGGGVIFDTCVHSVDLFRYLVGEPERVEALSATRETSLGPALPVEDTAIVILKAGCGTLGVIEASWRTPPGEWTVTLYGTKATATVDYNTGQLRVRRAGQADWQLVDVPPGNRFERQIASFLACLRGTGPPRVTADDGVAANRILAAAYASAGRIVAS